MEDESTAKWKKRVSELKWKRRLESLANEKRVKGFTKRTAGLKRRLESDENISELEAQEAAPTKKWNDRLNELSVDNSYVVQDREGQPQNLQSMLSGLPTAEQEDLVSANREAPAPATLKERLAGIQKDLAPAAPDQPLLPQPGSVEERIKNKEANSKSIKLDIIPKGDIAAAPVIPKVGSGNKTESGDDTNQPSKGDMNDTALKNLDESGSWWGAAPGIVALLGAATGDRALVAGAGAYQKSISGSRKAASLADAKAKEGRLNRANKLKIAGLKKKEGDDGGLAKSYAFHNTGTSVTKQWTEKQRLQQKNPENWVKTMSAAENKQMEAYSEEVGEYKARVFASHGKHLTTRQTKDLIALEKTISQSPDLKKDIATLHGFQQMLDAIPGKNKGKTNRTFDFKAMTASHDVAFLYKFIRSLDDNAVRASEIDLAGKGNPVMDQLFLWIKNIRGAEGPGGKGKKWAEKELKGLRVGSLFNENKRAEMYVVIAKLAKGSQTRMRRKVKKISHRLSSYGIKDENGRADLKQLLSIDTEFLDKKFPPIYEESGDKIKRAKKVLDSGEGDPFEGMTDAEVEAISQGGE